MIDSPYLLPFDLFQQLVLWLGTSMHAYRKGRRFLESNTVLLRKEIERELDRLITAHVEEKVEMKQQMQHHQDLLRIARHKGGSSTAIREAYINVYGGFALDLPPWLEIIEQQRSFLLRIQRPERTNRAHVQLLRQALSHAQSDSALAPEITAEILNELGYTLLQGPLPLSYLTHLRLLEEAISYHEHALTIYTYARYPLQYARTCTYLGTAYQRYARVHHSQTYLEQALTHFKSALCMYTPTEHPEEWGTLQSLIGTIYAQWHAKEPAINLDHAVYCHEMALQVVQEETFPLAWARIQAQLADTHLLYHADQSHLESALHCYLAALRIYSRQQFPREWADIHAKLATTFQRMESSACPSSPGRALVCCESSLQIFTIDAYPVEYATNQFLLGRIFHCRTDGDCRAHLKQALQHYREALTIFTDSNFPMEHEEIAHYLEQAQKTFLSSGQYDKIAQ